MAPSVRDGLGIRCQPEASPGLARSGCHGPEGFVAGWCEGPGEFGACDLAVAVGTDEDDVVAPTGANQVVCATGVNEVWREGALADQPGAGSGPDLDGRGPAL